MKRTEIEHGRYTLELVLRKAGRGKGRSSCAVCGSFQPAEDAPADRWSSSFDVTTAEREMTVIAAMEEGAQKLHELLFAEGVFGEMQGDPPTDEAWWADESLW